MPSRRLLPTLALFLPCWCAAQDDAEFSAILARYGQINTVAGSGARDDCNDWLSIFEGSRAVWADLSRPHMAAADAEGNIYIADKEGYSIRKVDLSGNIHTVAGNGTFGAPTADGPATATPLWAPNGLHVFPDGTFYFLTINDHCESETILPGGRVHRVTPAGTLTTLFEDPQLVVGRGLHVSLDHSTITYCSGETLRSWTADQGISDLATGFLSLGNIDRLPDGGFLVTDRGAHLVWRVHPDGSREVVAGNGFTTGGGHGQLAAASALNEVRGVAAVDTGGFFVCTHRDSQVWYVDSHGRMWLLIDGDRSDSTHAGDGLPISTPGLKISEPRAVTLAPNGDLLITENDNGYIRRVTNITTPPRLRSIRHDASSGVLLEWSSHREARYLLRRSADLENWTDIPVTPGSGATTRFLDPEALNHPRAFYEVVEAD